MVDTQYSTTVHGIDTNTIAVVCHWYVIMCICMHRKSVLFLFLVGIHVKVVLYAELKVSQRGLGKFFGLH